MAHLYTFLQERNYFKPLKRKPGKNVWIYRNYWVKIIVCYTGDSSTLLSSLGFITVHKTFSKWTSEQPLCLHPRAVKVLLSCFSLSCRNSNCSSGRAKPWPLTKIQGNLNKETTGNEARAKSSAQRDSWAEPRHSSNRTCSLTSEKASFMSYTWGQGSVLTPLLPTASNT